MTLIEKAKCIRMLAFDVDGVPWPAAGFPGPAGHCG